MNTSEVLNDWQIDTLSRLYLSALSFSLVGSLSVVCISIIKMQDLNEQVKPLVQLGLADFLASTILMATDIINFLPLTAPLRYKVWLCELGLALCLMFYCISFLLVILYACESVFATQGWRERMEQGDQEEMRRRSRQVGVVYVFVWLVPAIVYVVYAVTISTTMADIEPVSHGPSAENSYNSSHQLASSKYCSSCLLFLHIQGDNCSEVDKAHDIFVRGMLFASLLCVLVICMVMYCRLHSWSRQYVNGLSRSRLQGALCSARYIIPNITICWSPALLLLSLSFVKQVTQKQLFALYFLQALLVSLHGFLNSIVYAWRRPNFRNVVFGRVSPERMALLPSSHSYFEESLSIPAPDLCPAQRS